MKNHIAVRMMMSVTLLLPNSILYFLFFNQQRLTDIWTRISNQIHIFPWVWLLIMPHLQRSFWTWVSNHIPQVNHYNDVITGAMASQITSLTIVYSFVYSGTDKKKHQSPASLGFVRGVHRWSVNSWHKWPVMRKMFSCHDVIMKITVLPR